MRPVAKTSWIAFLLIPFVLVIMGLRPDPDAKVGSAAPDFTLVDTEGTEHTLSDYQGQYVVLEWLNYDCPFVDKHYSSGNMQALQEQYRDQDVVWLSVVSSAPGKQGYFEPDVMNQRTAAHDGQQTAVLMDSEGEVGRQYGAMTTPQMYVISPEGTLLYNGAIDDKPTTSTADVEGATNYVVAALDEAMSGQEVTTSTTQPYGCSVKY